MRTDATQASSPIGQSTAWQTDPFTHQRRDEIDDRYTRGKVESDSGTQWHSFSGHERNCLFQNEQGQAFRDRSLVSGADNEADGRAAAVWDFDHDGRADLALVNANYPLLDIYHNEWTTTPQPSSKVAHFVALRLQGSNESDTPQMGMSARDAYGARIELRSGNRRWLREHRCGEGFAAQNSATLVIGVDQAEHIDVLTVTWPSGKRSEWRDLPVGRLLEVSEVSSRKSPQGTLVITNYEPRSLPGRMATRATVDLSADVAVTRSETLDMATLLEGTDIPRDRSLYLITTTATWCEACVRSQPQLQRLARRFRDSGQLELLGLPADPIDTPDDLRRHAEAIQAVYRVLADVSPEIRDRVVSILQRSLNTESIPCSLLVDHQGRIRQSYYGVPSVSAVGSWLQALEEERENRD